MNKEVQFGDFRKKKEVVVNESASIIETDPNAKKIIKEFLMRKNGISDNGLVSLIVFHNTGKVNEEYKEELELFNYVKDNKITEDGTKFINEEKTIERLKAMIN